MGCARRESGAGTDLERTVKEIMDKDSAAGHPSHVPSDLAELKGIGSHHADTSKSIGVDSIKELRHRNAQHLHQMIETRHGEVVGLSVKQCQTWIDEAKAYR